MYVKKLMSWLLSLVLVVTPLTCVPAEVRAEEGEGVLITSRLFPDSGVLHYVKHYLDEDQDGRLSYEELNASVFVDLKHYDVTTLQGLQWFSNIWGMEISTSIADLDFSAFSNLSVLTVNGGYQVSSIDLSMNTKLKALTLKECNIREVDVSFLPLLESLYLHELPVRELDLSANINLREILVGCNNKNPHYRNYLSSITLPESDSMNTLDLEGVPVTDLDLSRIPNVEYLYLADTSLTEIDVSDCTKLRLLDIENDDISSLDISANGELRTLIIASTQISSIDLSQNTRLQNLYMHCCPISSIDISNIPNLQRAAEVEPEVFENDGTRVTLQYLYELPEYNPDGNWYRILIDEGVQIVTTADPAITPTPVVTTSPTSRPSSSPTVVPSIVPSTAPSSRPTAVPSTAAPTAVPSVVPTGSPVVDPGAVPTSVPTQVPGAGVTEVPTGGPTVVTPTAGPADMPAVGPTAEPTESPVVGPTEVPTEEPTVEPAPEVLTGVVGFCERLYTCALGRESDVAGRDWWVDALRHGATGAYAAEGFFFSEEIVNSGITDEEFVHRLYLTFMDREPEDSEMDYWMNEMNNNGMARELAFGGFIHSTEWANVCVTYGILSGGMGVATITVDPSDEVIAFATRLYTTCLGREADEAGLEWWAGELANLRTTGSAAAQAYFFSDEFVNAGVDDEEFVDRLYLTFMDRNAGEFEFDYWLGEMGNGMSRETVFGGFAGSEEFGNICASYGIIR